METLFAPYMGSKTVPLIIESVYADGTDFN